MHDREPNLFTCLACQKDGFGLTTGEAEQITVGVAPSKHCDRVIGIDHQ